MFEKESLNETILYIAQKVTDIPRLLKIIYFANREHLHKWGRYITQHGRQPIQKETVIVENESFKIKNGCEIEPLRKPNTDFLSESDVECIDEAIKKYKKMPLEKMDKVQVY